MAFKINPEEVIQHNIIAAIESAIETGKATGKWVMPWNKAENGGLPKNVATGKFYRGSNILQLWMAGYSSNLFGTYRQWQSKNCQVRKGEKGSIVVFYKKGLKKGMTEDELNSTFFYMQYSTVFAAEQVEGYNDPSLNPVNADHEVDIDDTSDLDKFFNYLNIPVTITGDKAFYRRSTDYVYMPNKQAFNTVGHYYSTLAHEMTHATGNKNRTGRHDEFTKLYEGNSRTTRAMEELVAELGAAFTMAHLGKHSQARVEDDHAEYIASWLQAIKDDPKAIHKAARYACTALDWMKDQQPKEE